MNVNGVPRETLIDAVVRANGGARTLGVDDLMAMADMHGMYGEDIVKLSRKSPEERGDLPEELDRFVRTFRIQSDYRLFQGLEGATSAEMRVDAEKRAEKAGARKSSAIRNGLIGLGVAAATGGLLALLPNPLLGAGLLVGVGAAAWNLALFNEAREDQHAALESKDRLTFWETELQKSPPLAA